MSMVMVRLRRFHTCTFYICIEKGDLKGFHFNQSHLESMGRSLCEVLLEIADPNQSRLVEIVRHLVET